MICPHCKKEIKKSNIGDVCDHIKIDQTSICKIQDTIYIYDFNFSFKFIYNMKTKTIIVNGKKYKSIISDDKYSQKLLDEVYKKSLEFKSIIIFQ